MKQFEETEMFQVFILERKKKKKKRKEEGKERDWKGRGKAEDRGHSSDKPQVKRKKGLKYKDTEIAQECFKNSSRGSKEIYKCIKQQAIWI